MATYPPPNFTEPLNIFNPSNWIEGEDGVIDIAFLNANYLKYPVAQGLETLQAITVNGVSTFNNAVNVNGGNIATFNGTSDDYSYIQGSLIESGYDDTLGNTSSTQYTNNQLNYNFAGTQNPYYALQVSGQDILRLSTTALTSYESMLFSGNGLRFQGDFDNATFTNRLMFQTSTVNGFTSFGMLPNGTNTASGNRAFNNSNPTNCCGIAMTINATNSLIQTQITGTGTLVPFNINMGATVAMSVNTTANVSFPLATRRANTYNTISSSLSSTTSTYSQTYNGASLTATLPTVDANNVGIEFLITNTNASALTVIGDGVQLIYSSTGSASATSRSLSTGHSHIFSAIRTTGATTYGWSMV